MSLLPTWTMDSGRIGVGFAMSQSQIPYTPPILDLWFRNGKIYGPYWHLDWIFESTADYGDTGVGPISSPDNWYAALSPKGFAAVGSKILMIGPDLNDGGLVFTQDVHNQSMGVWIIDTDTDTISRGPLHQLQGTGGCLYSSGEYIFWPLYSDPTHVPRWDADYYLAPQTIFGTIDESGTITYIGTIGSNNMILKGGAHDADANKVSVICIPFYNPIDFPDESLSVGIHYFGKDLTTGTGPHVSVNPTGASDPDEGNAIDMQVYATCGDGQYMHVLVQIGQRTVDFGTDVTYTDGADPDLYTKCLVLITFSYDGTTPKLKRITENGWFYGPVDLGGINPYGASCSIDVVAGVLSVLYTHNFDVVSYGGSAWPTQGKIYQMVSSDHALTWSDAQVVYDRGGGGSGNLLAIPRFIKNMTGSISLYTMQFGFSDSGLASYVVTPVCADSGGDGGGGGGSVNGIYTF